MKDWKSIERGAQCAKTERERKKARCAIAKYVQKASLSELIEMVGTAEGEFVREQAEIELWWRGFDKKPENLLELIRTSSDKNKKVNAIRELGNLQYTDAVSRLTGFLGDIDLRDPAALALRKMPSQEVFEPIIQSIKRHPDGAECLLYTLQVIDCSDAAEFLVELFISKPNAPVVRDDIFVCFARKAVKCIPKQIKMACCSKLLNAIKESPNQGDVEELRQLYKVVLQIEEI